MQYKAHGLKGRSFFASCEDTRGLGATTESGGEPTHSKRANLGSKGGRCKS